MAPFAVLAWLAGAPVLTQTGIAQVDRVIDGDTIRVQLDGARSTVRLTSVDTPETRHPTRGVEPYGPEAAAYGRLLRYVVPRHGDPRVPLLPTTRIFTAGSPGAPGAPRAMEPLT